jgi:DnaJ-class molecular chaperone
MEKVLFDLLRTLGSPVEQCPKCWGRGSFQTTAATLGFYARCWLCKGEGIVDLRFYS